MQLILFDDHSWANLLPLSFTRPVADLRVGILTIAEKWEKRLGLSSSFLSQEHLSEKFPANSGEDNLLICASLLPDENLIATIKNLQENEGLVKENRLLAAHCGASRVASFDPETWTGKTMEYEAEFSAINFPWDIFRLNGQEIQADMEILTASRKSEKLSDSVWLTAPENIFVEAGFKGEHFTLNASSGPIYLGADSEIMEGSVIRGPFALCEGSTVKLAAKIYGPTTIGPHSKVGGEVNNCVIHSNSNKGHDGFLGNSVLGEWCNIGADTNNSNLKNNYAEVKVWNYPQERFIKTGLQFSGLIMGDHSKCGINTMFNTGTVVGVSANIFGSGFPRNFIPSFSWGGAAGMSTYKMNKVLETAGLVMERRGQELSQADLNILQWVFDYSEKYRK